MHVYLPDALGREAKKAGLNLSGLLRGAVEAELRPEGQAPQVKIRRAGKNVEIVVKVAADALR
jgi:hypothetical protein